MIGKIVRYMSDVRKETSKVIWPARDELRESATIVVVLTLMCAAFVFCIDLILNNILKFIL